MLLFFSLLLTIFESNFHFKISANIMCCSYTIKNKFYLSNTLENERISDINILIDRLANPMIKFVIVNI